jgi:sugar phosphate isomerase/epimerase
MDFMVDQALRLAHLAEAYLHGGQIDLATSLAAQALKTAAEYQQHGGEAWGEWLLGEIHAHDKSADASEAHYRRAMALAGDLDMAPLIGHCHLGLGKLYRRARQSAKAQEHVAKAADAYRYLQMPLGLQQAEALLQWFKE